MKMGTLALLLSLSLCVLTGCECNTDVDLGSELFHSEAVITSYDLRRCGCCGGHIVEIEGEDSERNIYAMPDDSGIGTIDEEYPIAVKISWYLSGEICPKVIFLESIELK